MTPKFKQSALGSQKDAMLWLRRESVEVNLDRPTSFLSRACGASRVVCFSEHVQELGMRS